MATTDSLDQGDAVRVAGVRGMSEAQLGEHTEMRKRHAQSILVVMMLVLLLHALPTRRVANIALVA